MNNQSIILCENLEKSLTQVLKQYPHDKLFTLTDAHTSQICLPELKKAACMHDTVDITMEAGDMYKTPETLMHVWQILSDKRATRHSLLINLGGGMVTDLGGFAAATFKRGIAYINIPTTLLAMVDAAVGGKTAVNFNGLKNEIGVFAPAVSVLIDTKFLINLDRSNFLSGYAEMLKHGLISDTAHWSELLTFHTSHINYLKFNALVGKSVQIKERFVTEDPYEHGIRKALNLGHTTGHAFESFALAENHPVLHGYAVAWGIICELYLSCRTTGFPKDKMYQTMQFIKKHYGTFHFNCNQYECLYEYMTHDKKNTGDAINFTLLSDIGEIKINQKADKKTIFEMFDFYRECMGE